MVRARSLPLFVALVLGACSNDEPTDTQPPVVDTDPSPTGPTGNIVVDLVPAALGIELETGFKAANGTDPAELVRYAFEGDTQGTVLSPTLTLTVTDIEYFSIPNDDPKRRFHFCNFYAIFPHIVVDPAPEGENFDYDAGKGASGVTTPQWFFAEGRADIYANSAKTNNAGEVIFEGGNATDSEACLSLKDQGYPDILDGMHVGIGFGDITPYLLENSWDNFNGLAEWEPAVNTMFIAMNHPNSTAPGGFDFLPHDWTSAAFFEAPVTEVELQDGEGNLFTEDVATATVDPTDSTLVFGMPQTDALVRGFTFWYEDYPNFDTSLLKEGVPTIP